MTAGCSVVGVLSVLWLEALKGLGLEVLDIQ